MLTWPAIGAIEQLPDGRRIVALEPGGIVVVGRANAYPHPVPGCDWLAPRPRRARRPRQNQPVVHRPPRPIRILPDARETAPTTRRAEALLESLLQPQQLGDWRSRRRFWVDTPRGPVELGKLYALVHRPNDDPGTERILCVVPDGYQRLPIADIWANLLLVLAVEPDAFFRVAIERERRPASLATRTPA